MALVALIGVIFGLNGCAVTARLVVPVAERVETTALFRVPPGEGAPFIVLTIDDTPSTYTAEFLDLLARHNVNATFFVHTDQIDPAGAALLHRALAEGHDLANHGAADVHAARLSAADFAAQFARADLALAAFGAEKWYRPAQGAINHETMDPVLDAHGYGESRRYILASFVPWDAARGKTDTPDADQNARLARRYAGQLSRLSSPGAIVVFHDGTPRGNEARAKAALIGLDAFLTDVKARGYQVKSLREAMASS